MKKIPIIVLIIFYSVSLKCQNNFDSLFIDSYDKFEEGNYQESLELISILMDNENYTSFYPLIYMRAILLYELGKYSESLYYFKKSFSLNPELFVSFVYQYYCCDSLNLEKEKQKLLININEWDANNAPDLISRIDFYFSIDEKDLAYLDIIKLKEISNQDYMYHLKLSKYFFYDSEYENALDEIEKILIDLKFKYNRYKIANYKKSCILYKLGNFVDAYSLFEEIYILEESQRSITAILNNYKYGESETFLEEEKKILQNFYEKYNTK